ncbi:MAG TPA: ATP-binding protein [Rhizomicrobium sp.]|jgi:hypothetical protein
MLIQFKVGNYRSFCGQQTIAMTADASKEHFETHTAESGINNLGRLLRSAAIYGPNAAGKTNLLKALQFMQQVVVTSATSAPTTKLPHDPFRLSSVTKSQSTDFEIAIIKDGVRYEYGFSLGPQRVENEFLLEYPHGRGRRLFERTWNGKDEEYEWNFSTHFTGNKSLWRDATRDNALFLSMAVQLNNQQLKPVFEWFQKRLVVIVGNMSMNAGLTLKLFESQRGKDHLLSFIREADSGISDVEIQREPLSSGPGYMIGAGAPIIEQGPANSPPNLVRVSFSHLATDTRERVKFDLSDESNGTQALFKNAGAWLNVFANGEVLLFDEIDTSLHPLLTRFLIAQFHSDATNPNGAQLVFSTHDTTLLNQELFRRDQIWFVEKQTDASTRLYPLSEFSPRNDEAIERWYMRGRYGALPILSQTRH